MGYAFVCASLVAGFAFAGCGGSDTVSTLPLPATVSTLAPTGTTSAGGGVPAGDVVFASTCSACHGADGTGSTGPDLTVRNTLTKNEIVAQVTNGGSSMPEYGSRLSPAEIDAVAQYVLDSIMK